MIFIKQVDFISKFGRMMCSHCSLNLEQNCIVV
jgi:hypothetical protein